MNVETQLNKPESLNDALTQLVKSIAIEEEALATLMRAEAEKTLAFVGKDQNLPTHPSTSEFIQFNQTVTKILDSILMAEWMLMKKIDSVMQFQYLAGSSGISGTTTETAGLQRDSGSNYRNKTTSDSFDLDDSDFEDIDY